jgi:ABC-type nickel/cobalt efflux system permease component RcnA
LNIASALENATPLLLIIFGFGYALYAFYKHIAGRSGHSHGIPIVNKWLGIDPHAFSLSQHSHSQDHHHNHAYQHTGADMLYDHPNAKSAKAAVETDYLSAASSSMHRLQGKNAGWGLVAILGLTPCIALLPLSFASLKYGAAAIVLVSVIFAISTIATIVIMTWIGYKGLKLIQLDFFEKYGEIIAGLIIGLIGLSTKVFEL